MTLFQFITALSALLMQSERFRTCRAYRSTLRSILSFNRSADMPLEQVFNKSFVAAYQTYLRDKGLQLNTISFYMRMLRSIYNQAVERELVAYTPCLFAQVYTGYETTVKRAVDPDIIRRMAGMDISANPALELARDLFMLGFYLQGMSFIDLAYLRHSQYNGHSITYYRQKTGSRVTVPVVPQARKIIGKYAGRVSQSGYLLPVLSGTGMAARAQYETALRRQNRNLKKLMDMGKIRENITTYVARHSWATTAYHSGIDVSLISQGMGHSTENVTRIYLAAFNLNIMAEANRLVVAAIQAAGEREKKKEKKKGWGNKNVRHFVSDGHKSGANIEVFV